MTDKTKANHLIEEGSPYLLQHAHNPVDWWPWCAQAFEKARQEEKPIFLSIGYSTCHWCHVMAHESFEDESVAAYLNQHFVCIKVDREERPDVDAVYMRVCQAMTGSGGWPTSIWMTPDSKPFYAGTYFPRETFLTLLQIVSEAWENNRFALLQSSEQITAAVQADDPAQPRRQDPPIQKATTAFRSQFDQTYGGFGRAPKFPSAHNLMFLLRTAPDLAEQTLLQMYRGGIFDHIGGGFCRYSTDRQWLVPHFEKMLYDNAMLAMAYLLAFEATGKLVYRTVAKKIFSYLEQDLQAPDGGFYAAQDADAGGAEGAFYVFTPHELTTLLGQTDGERFCHYYGITPEGNFEGKSIPNLMHQPLDDTSIAALVPQVYAYRKNRMALATDQKILTGWNALAAAAYAMAYRILKEEHYLQIARSTLSFLAEKLTSDTTVFAGMFQARRSVPGFLDDYAFLSFALLQLHQATMNGNALAGSIAWAQQVIDRFADEKQGGFFFSGTQNEALISRPKEVFDGAIPSGNSVMAYNLIRLSLLSPQQQLLQWADRQRDFMNSVAGHAPMGCGFYLYAALPVKRVVCALTDRTDLNTISIRSDWIFSLADPTAQPVMNGKATFYVCENETCLPPSNTVPWP